MGRKATDLTGMRFGMLTVKYRGENKIIGKRTRPIWICDCDCGNKNIQCTADSLLRGHKKSCGCLAHKFKDYTGMTFNRLTVISIAEIKNGMSYWWCQCNCGNPELKKVSRKALVNGNVQSCGCLRNEKVKEAIRKPNAYDLSGKYGIGYCSNTNEIGTNEFYFDLEDYDTIKDYHWYFDKDGYVIGYKTASDKKIPMHRLIMGLDNVDPTKIVPDHIKHIKHDNRKSELRIATRSQNSINRKSRGVYYNNDRKKWCAQINVSGKNINLGRYDSFQEAKDVWEEAKNKYHGEWAYDNSMSA